ncbi:hypothetical protein Glove_199g214 [Diversispora epigaea]|uniref:ZSWIM1/3 RNaseH-like domain-containing protein n=1 Tax=Diversispora epigaea TaxID=1348612 RepID=A0A397IMR7_9GLOM|nr:hypothetical protein Glove_199g214 [Diversispora epigaea]
MSNNKIVHFISDEKRALLFNIKNILEISEEEFDNSWWPLVSNVWTQFNSCKLNNGDSWKSSTRKENIPIKKRRTTMIRPANICHAKIKVIRMTSKKLIQIKRYNNTPDHTHTLIESDRLKHLKRKEVANIKYKLHDPLETHLVDNIELESDILETISYLKNQEYYCERYYISQKSTYGIVFAHPKQLKKLHQYGWLTLIDSTHKTNKHDWHLFTLYIRDSYNCWDVGAHFFVSNEDSDTIAEALKIIRNICKNWIPGYVLMDQSNIEANSIKKVFPGLKAGENECRIILCTVHIVRTWIAKIYEKKTREIMIGAMHKRTKIGCEQFIQNAIQQCSVSADFTSTNALESYHSELKRTTSFLYGLIGASYKIVALDQKKRAESENTAFNFQTKKISAYGVDDEFLEEIHKFPFPVQQMLIKEIGAVMDRLEKGKCVPGLTSLECHCLFHNRYLLPCKHIFHEHMYGNQLLTDDTWKKFQGLFEENGFEIYEQRELVIEEIPIQTDAEKKIENRRHTVNELTERVQYSPPSTVEVVNNIVLQVRMSDTSIKEFVKKRAEVKWITQWRLQYRTYKWMNENISDNTDWQTTWSMMHGTKIVSSFTNKEDQKYRSFNMKVLNDEPPVINNLHVRKSNIYRDNRCVLCKLMKEDSIHVFFCREEAIKTQAKLKSLILAAVAKHQGDTTLNELNNEINTAKYFDIDIVRQVNGTIEETEFSLVDCVRGLFPMELKTLLSKNIKELETRKRIISEWYKQSREYLFSVWVKRCKQVHEWEEINGITKKMKKSKGVSNNIKPSEYIDIKNSLDLFKETLIALWSLYFRAVFLGNDIPFRAGHKHKELGEKTSRIAQHIIKGLFVEYVLGAVKSSGETHGVIVLGRQIEVLCHDWFIVKGLTSVKKWEDHRKGFYYRKSAEGRMGEPLVRTVITNFLDKMGCSLGPSAVSGRGTTSNMTRGGRRWGDLVEKTSTYVAGGV